MYKFISETEDSFILLSLGRCFTNLKYTVQYLKQVGEHCQAIYSVDGQYHDAKIEEINADGEVSVKFKGFRYEISMLI